MSHIQIRISDEQKKEVKEVLDRMNLTYSSAIKLFFEELVEAQDWPYKEAEQAPAVSWKVTNIAEGIKDDTRDIPKTDSATYVAKADNTSDFAWSPFKSRRIG